MNVSPIPVDENQDTKQAKRLERKARARSADPDTSSPQEGSDQDDPNPGGG